MCGMKNWSTDVKVLKKDKAAYEKWRLEQLINFGLDGEKLSARKLRELLPKLKIDPNRRAYLELLLHESKDSH